MGAELGLVLTFVLFLGLLAWGMPIAYAILLPAMTYLWILGGMNAFRALGLVSWANMNSFTLTAIPLFVLMAELLDSSGLITRVFRGLSRLLAALPGGLLQTSMAGCAVFGAIAGSSITTAAAIGAAALPQLRARGYDARLSTGSIAAGGTLGILLPPSLAMVIYATFTETSLAKLFMAGVVPGVLLTLMFMAYIAYRAIRDPSVAPREDGARSGREVVEALVDVFPVLALTFVVMWSMYAGWATPTEAAAVGSALAIVLSVMFGSFSLRSFLATVRRTVLTSGSILFLVFSAYVFSHALSFGGVGAVMTNFIVGLDLERWQFILMLFVFYIVLGCMVESLGMIVLTVPIIYPMLAPYDIDAVWFGILLVVFIEMAQIHPPTGLNLFVIQGIARGKYVDVVMGAIPFFFIMLVLAVWMVIWPDMALWLPAQM